MQTITNTINLYELKELDVLAQDKAVVEIADMLSNDFFEWTVDEMIAEWKQQMREKGHEIDQVYYSGFWSQGDGLCFTGEYKYKDKLYEIIHHGHYSHSGTMFIAESEKAEQKARKDADELYKTLEYTHNDMTDTGSVLEYINENEIRFTEDGTPYHC